MPVTAIAHRLRSQGHTCEGCTRQSSCICSCILVLDSTSRSGVAAGPPSRSDSSSDDSATAAAPGPPTKDADSMRGRSHACMPAGCITPTAPRLHSVVDTNRMRSRQPNLGQRHLRCLDSQKLLLCLLKHIREPVLAEGTKVKRLTFRFGSRLSPLATAARLPVRMLADEVPEFNCYRCWPQLCPTFVRLRCRRRLFTLDLLHCSSPELGSGGNVWHSRNQQSRLLYNVCSSLSLGLVPFCMSQYNPNRQPAPLSSFSLSSLKLHSYLPCMEGQSRSCTTLSVSCLRKPREAGADPEGSACFAGHTFGS